MPSGIKAPRWNLDSIYTGYDSKKYRTDRAALVRVTKGFLAGAADTGAKKASATVWLESVLRKIEKAYGLFYNLESYVYGRYATNTREKETLAELNGLETDAIGLKDAEVVFRSSLNSVRKKLPAIFRSSKTCAKFRFYIEEQLLLQSRQMSLPEENLASDLNRAGGNAWGRLQETIFSTLSTQWSETETKTVVELRALSTSPDRKIRKRAYELELKAWETMEIPLAAALNGVKGFAVTLDERRKYESSLDKSVSLSRMSRKTLDSLIGVMEENQPVFRKYLKAKAKLLGLKKCAFYDLDAPVGDSTRTWSFKQAQTFIVKQFRTFAPDLAAFAQSAFDGGWIDAQSRAGKVGGAFCTYMPLAGESRILTNYDGSFDSIATLAHELGHGYHGSVMKAMSPLHQDYPMTLAETASIFCETIIFNRALESARSDLERIGILELFLQGATAVLVDILSRYQFENAVFEQRKTRELSPEELSDLMIKAQINTYGDGLDRTQLHKYMWAVKGHYYSPELSYYNYPYAFGHLLGLSLYAEYEENPDGFPQRYAQLLKITGKATANDVTASAGFDIESPEFWKKGVDVVEARVKEFSQLVKKVVG